VVEEIISSLSRMHSLYVIARNLAERYPMQHKSGQTPLPRSQKEQSDAVNDAAAALVDLM
jgi:TolB-like protein